MHCRLTTLALLSVSFAAPAQESGDGWYIGMDLGAAIAPQFNTSGRDNDVPTNCDGHLPPAVVGGAALPLTSSHAQCVRGQDQWRNEFNIGPGSLMELEIGIDRGNWRYEAEYSYRQHGGVSGGQNIAGDKQAEFVRTVEHFSAVGAHRVFFNVLREFRNDPRHRCGARPRGHCDRYPACWRDDCGHGRRVLITGRRM